jgi:two-component system, NarL family, response regulator YdfI
MTIRVLIVASAAIVRSGLAAMLAIDPKLMVVGMTANLDLLGADVDRLRPDLIVLDLGNEYRPNLWEKLLSIQESQDPIGIIITVVSFDRLDINAAIGAGVRGILPDTSTEAELTAAVVAVSMGLVVLDPGAIALFAVPATAALSAGFSLTPREIEVLTRLGSGLGNKAIGQSLHISEHTVKFHISSIFQKLGVSTRTEAVTAGVRLGLILL